MLEIVAYLLIGIVAGTFSGLLGIGGGLIVVPALALVFKLASMPSNIIMHMAAGTSLAAMVVSSFSSMRAHYRHGINIWIVYKRLFLGILLGTISGVILASFLRSEILQIIFGLIVIIVAFLMLLNFQPAPHRRLPGFLGLSLVTFLIGIKSGLLGLGGGIITVPFLLYCNVPIRQAIGTSTAVSFTIALVGTVTFILTGVFVADLPHWSTGYIYWPAVLGIGIVSPFFATLGAALSHRLPVGILRRIFAVFLLVIGIRMLF